MEEVIKWNIKQGAVFRNVFVSGVIDNGFTTQRKLPFRWLTKIAVYPKSIRSTRKMKLRRVYRAKLTYRRTSPNFGM